jgi:general secretion pathway protein D
MIAHLLVGAVTSFTLAAPAEIPTPAPTEAPVSRDAPATELPAGFDRCERHGTDQRFRITLPKEAELVDLINWMSSVSCQKFIWDPAVRGGKVSVLAPESVTLREAYAAFHSALQTMGLTVEPAGEFFKIVESGEAKSRALPLYAPGEHAPASDRYVTQLYRVKGDRSAELRALAEGLKTKAGSIDAVGDLLVITDTGNNVQRLLAVIEQLDAPLENAEHIFFYQLRHADPEGVAETVRSVFGVAEGNAAARTRSSAAPSDPGKGTKPASTTASTPSRTESAMASRVIVDAHTGTLILVARPEDYEVIANLIARIDVPLPGGATRFNVRRLKNADPEEVANVLKQLAAQGSGTEKPGARGAGTSQSRVGDTVNGEIRITADPSTRALIIHATQADFLALSPVIDELDIARKQVYIEVYVLELSIDKNLGAGARLHFGGQFDTAVAGTTGTSTGFAATNGESVGGTLIDSSLLSGLAAGVLGPTITGSGALLGTNVDVPAFGVIIQALQSDSDVNIVSEPHIYTSDNKEALIEVGEQRPVLGSFTNAAGAGSTLVPQQSVNLKDIKLSLKVTPHVNDDTTVTLDVELENENFAEQLALGVRTTKRKIKLDDIVAHDDQPIVLGGLIQEKESINESGVPGLSKIPLLGWFFKTKKKRREKVNLLMIMVPHVLNGPDDARRIHKRRMDERLEFLERQTAFKRRDLDTAINYSRKSGLLSAVDVASRRMTEELAERVLAEREMERTAVTGDIGLVPKVVR